MRKRKDSLPKSLRGRRWQLQTSGEKMILPESQSITDSLKENLERGLQLLKRRKEFFLCILLVALVWTAFFPSLKNNFVSYDDVTSNPWVQSGLTWKSIGWAFTTLDVANWHPLTWLSYMLDREIFGPKPWGYHLTNLLLHTTDTILVFLVFSRMTGALWRSFFIAALFGVHPLHVESVAWIAERKDVLSALFWMLTLWAYWRFVEELKLPDGESKKFYRLALIFFALGLMSKPMLVTVPFVLLLLDWWPLQRFGVSTVQRLVVEKIPFFLLTATSCVITVIAQKNGGAIVPISRLPLSDRMGNAVFSYERYLGKLFRPSHLAAYYPHPDQWPLADILPAAFLIAIISLLIFAFRRRRYLTTGWLWFLGTLIPVIGLVQVGGQSMADRYSYIPSIGIFIMVTWAAWDLLKMSRAGIVASTVAATAIILICIPLTRRQAGYWKNDEILFHHALAVTKNNYWTHYLFGQALKYDDHLDEAVQQFKIATKMNPGDPRVHVDFGTTLEKEGHYDEALREYRRALTVDPNFAPAHVNLGIALGRRGEITNAIHELQIALKLKPYLEGAHYNLGNLFVRSGRLGDGIAQYQEALKLNPRDAEVCNNLGVAFLRTNRLGEAVDQFQKAIELKPADAETHNNLGTVLYRKGLLDKAIDEYQEALRLNPDFSAAKKNLAMALKRKKEFQSYGNKNIR